MNTTIFDMKRVNTAFSTRPMQSMQSMQSIQSIRTMSKQPTSNATELPNDTTLSKRMIMIPNEYIVQTGKNWSLIPIFDSLVDNEEYIIGWKLHFFDHNQNMIITNQIIQADINEFASSIFKTKGGKFYKVFHIDKNFNTNVWNHPELNLRHMFNHKQLIAYATVDDLINNYDSKLNCCIGINTIEMIQPVTYTIFKHNADQDEKYEEERIANSIFT